jgi:hypothetical protein
MQFNSLFRNLIVAFLLLFCSKINLAQLQCDNDTSYLKSLIDLQFGTYLGFQGGLYPDGYNTMPYPHFAAGMNISRQVLPLDTLGNLDLLDGKAGLICLGASTAGNAFNHFKSVAEADPMVNPCLRFVNAALGAKGLEIMLDTVVNSWYWDDNVMVDIEDANISRYQVQVIWIMVTSRVDTLMLWPYQPRQVADKFEALMPILLAKFPNLKQVYASGFGYGGYADPTKEFYDMIVEPASYWNNWSIKFLVERQIDGDPDLKYTSPDRKSPWIGWGPHIWADGIRKNVVDGLYWYCAVDYKPDGGGYHLSNEGKDKAGELIYNFFKNSTVAADWFRYNTRWVSCDPDFRTTGLEVKKNPEIKIFPNPNNGDGYIEINEISPGDLHIQIVNAVGEVVYQRSALATENYYLQELHLGTLPAGIYNLTINSEDSESSVSFLIQ